jgi:H+/Cl- antiporter ClcA
VNPGDRGYEPEDGVEAEGVAPPLMGTRAFRILLRNATILGVVAGIAGLVFLAVITVGGELWYDPHENGWLDGEVWWIGVTGGAGLLVGMLNRFLKMPAYGPGLIEEAQKQYVEPAKVPRVLAVSAVSLIGGASLGPEQALGTVGGGVGVTLARRSGASEDEEKTTVLAGMSSAYGGLLSSPLISALLVLELARPEAGRYFRASVGTLLSAAIAFAIYFPLIGEPFVKLFEVPRYEYKDWHLLGGVALGLVGAMVALMLVVTVGVMRRLTTGLESRPILRSTLGGVGFGVIGVVLPLTLFTGQDQLPTLIEDGAELGTILVIAVMVGKILAFALCQSTGFIGGPFLPSMFIGGTAGVAVNLLVPDLPLGLTFACVMVAVPGAVVGIPFTLVVLAAVTTNSGVVQSAPITIAALTAYLAVSGSGLLATMMQRAAARSTSQARRASGDTDG